jgi:hypothetical protein
MPLMARAKLRIIIPLVQVLILILAFSLDPLLGRRYVGRSDLAIAYIVTPEHLVLKLDFPLAILGMPIIYLTARAFPNPGPPTTALNLAIFGAFALAIVTSTAAFWYLVVVEVEMRKRKTSRLRFSGRLIERLKATVMILIGVGAAVYALWDGYQQLAVLDQLSRNHNFLSVFVVDTLIGGLFLIGWAAALITMGVQDIIRVSSSG